MKINKEEIKKILDHLEKHGFTYYGFDKLNYCDLFIKQEDWKIERVEIMPIGISFQAYRLDTNPLRYESTPLMLYHNDIEYFKKLYDYVKENKCTLPPEFAKNQKELDRAYKWEMGIDTFCEFDGKSLSCGVKEEENE